jgi:uroporphyrinogen decarboxylase
MPYTPRRRLIDALEIRQPRHIVPHFEMEFQLCEEAFGTDFPEEEAIQSASGAELDRMLGECTDLHIRVAETYEWSGIVAWRPYDGEACLQSIRDLRRRVGDTYMIVAFAGGGTLGIPEGNTMMGLSELLLERPAEGHAMCERILSRAVDWGKRAFDAGAELLILNTDYALNQGPFLSPEMFREFVTPYLQRNVAVLKEYGAYVMLHTDGQIMPIMDQLMSSEPHALQSIDPVARMDIAEVKRLYGDRLCLMGNVDCVMLQDGTPEQIDAECRDCILAAKPGGGYIFSTSNVVYKGMPLRNYELMLEALQKYGRYDEAVESHL